MIDVYLTSLRVTLSNDKKRVPLHIHTFIVTRAVTTAHIERKNDVTVLFCLVHCIYEVAMLVVHYNYKFLNKNNI